MKKIQKVVIATANQGKLKEIQHYFQNVNLAIFPQSDFAVTEVEETGKTFIENALIKARHVCQVTGLPALGDDSGLVIDALNGAPGIYSARYAGVHGDDVANIAKVLQQMQNVDDADRTAHFYCVMALMRHAEDPAPIISIGSWHGVILKEPCGKQGFGYDPIFYVPTEQCSAAELELTLKNRLSHRGQALAQLHQQCHEFI